MNYSHGIANNVTKSIRMAYENDVVYSNIIRCFLKMRILYKNQFFQHKNYNFEIKNQKCQKNEKNYFVRIF